MLSIICNLLINCKLYVEHRLLFAPFIFTQCCRNFKFVIYRLQVALEETSQFLYSVSFFIPHGSRENLKFFICTFPKTIMPFVYRGGH